jgi:EAL domain-containing protein (putative c-di-GMP-specific phosphodiesterase class I)
MIQGYYFAKPMPKDEYEERMKEVYHDPEKE